jgi:Fis family transcriptional regulator
VGRTSEAERLADCVREALDNYFAHLDGHTPTDLYEMVLAEVEKPLFSCVLQHMGGNQTRAAQALGISRSTLRKKLARYQID